MLSFTEAVFTTCPFALITFTSAFVAKIILLSTTVFFTNFAFKAFASTTANGVSVVITLILSI